MKKFSIIIPTYNRQELLSELLQSLIVQKFNPDYFEILIIDNNSDYDVKQLIQNFLDNNSKFDIKYFLEKEQGVQYAWNKGITEAQGKLLIFVDDDITFHIDYFFTLEKDFNNDLDNIAGGGNIAPVFEHQKPAWISKYVMPYFAEINLGEKSTFPNKKSPFATNMLVSKNIFNKIGMFNTEKYNDKSVILPGTFEKDLFKRIKKAGISIYYYHDLAVWHFIPQEKIDKGYIKEQVVESGKFIKEVSKKKGFLHYIYALWENSLKWIAAYILAVYYIFTTQWEKAIMIFKLRWWKTMGLFGIY